jgi:hypothetical protein
MSKERFEAELVKVYEQSKFGQMVCRSLNKSPEWCANDVIAFLGSDKRKPTLSLEFVPQLKEACDVVGIECTGKAIADFFTK